MDKDNKELFCFLGRTSSGKSALALKIAKEFGLKILKSYTTRLPRPEEICNPDVDHIFIFEEEMKQYENEIIAYTKIGNAHYFCTREQLFNSNIYVIDPNGYKYLQSQNIEGLTLIPIYIYAPFLIRAFRFVRRKESFKKFLERNRIENDQFTAFENSEEKMIVINNYFRSLNSSIHEFVQKLRAF